MSKDLDALMRETLSSVQDGAGPAHRGPDVDDIGRRVRRRQQRPVTVLSVVAVIASAGLVYGAVSPNGFPTVVSASPGEARAATPPDGREAVRNDCPPKPTDYVPKEDGSWPGLDEAARETRAYAEKYAPDQFRGQQLCGTTGVLLFYRVPGDEELDRGIETIVGKYRDDRVTVEFEDSKFSQIFMDQISAAVASRSAEMARRGADLGTTGYGTADYVVVTVQDNVAEARDVLKDLGDQVQIVQAQHPVPLNLPRPPRG